MTPEPPTSVERFQVDLRGVVEILSRHLYSSPRVFVRELIQNARDAITARALHRAADENPDQGGHGVRIGVDGDDIIVSDDGIGLTGDEMRTLLATIGASSKREDLERAREDFLGRFGIGLLSCFLVADTIEVVSRSARTADAPTMRWTGRSDGTYAIGDSDEALPAPGTRVRVRLRPEEVLWASPRRLVKLATEFAGHLDVPVDVADGSGAAPVRVSMKPSPADLKPEDAAELCLEVFGFSPLTTLRLDIPMLGLRGLAYITPQRETTTSRAGDIVYSNGMLVARDNTQLAPDWAYFARLILDAGTLPLTASRESFQETSLTTEAAKQIGTMLRSHIVDLSHAHPDTFRRFVEAHNVGLRAMALDDPTMFRFVHDHVPFLTSRGERTLAELLDDTTEPVLYYSYAQREFDALAPLAQAQGRTVINAGHVHEPQILERLKELRPEVRLESLNLSVLVSGAASPSDRPLAHAVEQSARAALLGQDVQVVDFGTDALVGLELPAESGWLSATDQGTGAASGWGAIFGEFAAADEPRGPRLVLNIASPLVRSLGAPLPPHVQANVANTLRVLAMLHSGAPLDSRDHVILADSVAALVKTATDATGPA